MIQTCFIFRCTPSHSVVAVSRISSRERQASLLNKSLRSSARAGRSEAGNELSEGPVKEPASEGINADSRQNPAVIPNAQ